MLHFVCMMSSNFIPITMPKKTKKNAQPKDESEGNLSDDLQAETDQGVMKYLFSILYITDQT